MAQFFTRFIKGMVEDVVVEKLSNSKQFQKVAVHAVKAGETAQAAVTDSSKRQEVIETASSFFSALKAEIAKDLNSLSEKEPSKLESGKAAGKATKPMQ